MQKVPRSLSSATLHAPFVRQHRLYQADVAARTRWFQEHYTRQHVETDPRSGTWLRSLVPSQQGAVQYLKDSFPCVQWLLRYNLAWLLRDLIAGLTVGAVIIPQGMAYAKLAELPVEMGLYSSFIGGVLYFMFGSSKDINIGPVAIASIVTGSIVDEVQSVLPLEARAEIAGLAALMAGVVIFIVSLLRLGWLVNLIALPAIAAFVSGVAVTITATQISTLLGIRGIEENDAPYLIYINTFKKLGETKIDAAVGISALALLYFIKWATGRLGARQPRQRKLWFFVSTIRTVFTILLFILISFLVNRSRKTDPKFRILGAVPKGFHGTFSPKMSRKLFNEILPQLPTMVIVLLIEHLSIAKSFARINNYTVNANSELLAIGVSNVIGPFVGAYAVSGSFSRTAINAKAGSATPLAGVVAGVLVIFAIYFLAPMLFYIPNSVLAAVIMHAILDLITSPSTLYGFWRTSPLDLCIFVIGLTVTIFSSVETGLYVMIALSMAVYLWQIFKTHGHLLGEVRYRTHVLGPPDNELRYSAQQHIDQQYFLPLDHSSGNNPDIEIKAPPLGVFMYRLPEGFNYMNAARALDQLVEQIKQQTRPTTMTKVAKKSDQPWSVAAPSTEDLESAIQLRPTLKAIIIDFATVDHMDVTSAQALVDTRATLDRYVAPNTLQWHFANVANPWTRRALSSVGFGQLRLSKIGELERFDKVCAFVQKTEADPLIATPKSKSGDTVDLETAPDIGIAEQGATQLDCMAEKAADTGVENKARDDVFAMGSTRDEALMFGINRPYFHPDMSTALASVTLWLSRPSAEDEQ